MATRRLEPVKPIKAQVQETVQEGVVTLKKQVQETVVEPVAVKPKWKVMSGGITLLNKKSYTKGDVFEAEDWEVSKSVRDIVKCINPETLVPKAKPVEPKYFLQEVVPTAEEMDEDDYVTLYNIVNAKDKVISEKPLSKELANELLKKLNV